MGGLDWGTPLLESAVTERFALPPSLKEIRNYVDGAFVTTDRTFDNVSPLTGRVLAKVHEADAALVDRAVRAARQAVEGEWGRSTVEQRAAALHRVADIIERRFDDFLAAEIADTGRPLAQARKLIHAMPERNPADARAKAGEAEGVLGGVGGCHAVGGDEADGLDRPEVVQRIAGHEEEVCLLAGLDGAEVCAEAHIVRRLEGRAGEDLPP